MTKSYDEDIKQRMELSDKRELQISKAEEIYQEEYYLYKFYEWLDLCIKRKER